MKTTIQSGKALTKADMKNIFGGIGVGQPCGTQVCSRFQACCSRENASGQTVYYCTTTACL